ncbi:hypothetical protein [Chromobacterium sp. IIBBL 290-4]|uniref:hypothetical protein n=1 Tax=Chromobacterium sp. IIBBL 290-4 TaxID=2953890 RepID=UPI0020B78931|nr:hypothetical protein [Chromobacterium sp. IIBBL 290-4]UTH74056.1 hypothetical protein NKT35_21320 [Chromobacterium sp. IIBBL 290-4]
MSYLDTPRIHFAGVFQADPSTVNNDVRYYNNDTFRERYQHQHYPGGDASYDAAEGYWNPDGTGIFRFIDCKVTGARLGDQLLTCCDDDPVIGMRIENADRQAPGKIVDLDPQMQYVSQVWGLQVRLASATQRALFCGDLLPVALMNLWSRQLNKTLRWEQTMAANFQSLLQQVEWGDDLNSPLLQALRDNSDDGLLSINFNLYGYTRERQSQRFTMGLLSGSIGPGRKHEPKHFVLGRHLSTALMPAQGAPFPTQPLGGVYGFSCSHHTDSQALTADFGLALPITDGRGKLHNLGTLTLALTNPKEGFDPTQDTITRQYFAILGELDYQQADWYLQNAGIQTFSYKLGEEDQDQDGDTLEEQTRKKQRREDKAFIAEHINELPLLLLGPQRCDGSYPILTRESLDGFYARADGHVFRLNPDQPQTVEFWSTQFGQPLASRLHVWQQPPGNQNSNPMGGTGMGDNSLHPPVNTPAVGAPERNLSFPDTVDTNADGKGSLALTASPPPGDSPRGYIDGQLYALRCSFQPPPASLEQKQATPAGGPFCEYWNFISALAFNRIVAPERPNWERDIRPILRQYGNLYPIMSKHLVDLGCYDSVYAHRYALRQAFSLPPSDPNYMPVTRDLSDAKRAMLLAWLNEQIESPPAAVPGSKTEPAAPQDAGAQTAR